MKDVNIVKDFSAAIDKNSRAEDIPLSRPYITEAEKNAVLKVVSSGSLSMGMNVPAFEDAFRKYLPVREAVAVSSGTSGLQLAVKALSLEKGSEVVTTPFTFIATASVLCHEGLKPVFCDIDPKSLNLDPRDLERKITSKTRAVMVVDILGLPAEMEPIQRIAEEHDLVIVEDACEALGATYNGKKAGTFGQSAVFGFYPNKQITTGEGGMIVTDSSALAKRFRRLRNHGRSGKAMKFEEIGFNFRLNEFAAALGIVQLGKIEEIVAARRLRASWYREALLGINDIECMPAEEGRSPFAFYVFFPEKKVRDKIRESLFEKGIASGLYFPPLHLEKAFEFLNYRRGDLPVCEDCSDRILALPFWTDMSRKKIHKVSETIRKILSI